MANVIYIMGVSGSGKTTIGDMLSDQTGIPFFDGDAYHPPANISKMERGIPLNDDDRKGWLDNLNKLAREQVEKQETAIIGTSALKETYRERLIHGFEDSVKWVYLQGDFDTILSRVTDREAHFMPASLLESQFETLEEPDYGLHISIDRTPEEIVTRIMKELAL